MLHVLKAVPSPVWFRPTPEQNRLQICKRFSSGAPQKQGYMWCDFIAPIMKLFRMFCSVHRTFYISKLTAVILQLSCFPVSEKFNASNKPLRIEFCFFCNLQYAVTCFYFLMCLTAWVCILKPVTVSSSTGNKYKTQETVVKGYGTKSEFKRS